MDTSKADPVQSSAPPLEIAHVLFLDIVGFSLMQLNRQNLVVEQLQNCVRKSNEYRAAEARRQLVRIPTGDGMALAFFGDPLSAVRASLEIGAALKDDTDLNVRMGLHSGPVYVVEDINGQKNVTGTGINVAQRVMDCGDAGHILTSLTVAEVLSQIDEWNGCLEFLGEAQVKHEILLPVYKLSRDGVGKNTWPAKLASLQQQGMHDPLTRSARARRAPPVLQGKNRAIVGVTALLSLLILASVVAGIWRWRNTRPQATSPT